MTTTDLTRAVALARLKPAVLLWAVFILVAILEAALLVNLTVELTTQAIGAEVWHGHYDFFAFYSAAHFLSLGQMSRVYDPALVASYQHTFLSSGAGPPRYMPFLNPPFAAVPLAPLVLLGEPIARLVWFGLNSLLAVSIVAWLTKSMAGWKRVLGCAFLLGTFPIYQTLIEGQWSLVMLLGCLSGLHFARRGRYWTSGASLSVLWLKPQLAGIVLLGLLLFRFQRIALGMIAMLLLIVLVTLPFVGVHAYFVYVPLLVNVFRDHFNGAGAIHPSTWHGPLGRTEGLNGLFAGWLGQSSVVAVDVLSVLAIGATLLLFRHAAAKIRPGFEHITTELMLVASICVVLLIDPHLYGQDVTLVFLAIPLLLPHLKSPLILLGGLCLVADAPLLDQVLPLHLFTLVIWSLTIVICLAAAGLVPFQLRGATNAAAKDREGEPGSIGMAWLTRVFGLA